MRERRAMGGRIADVASLVNRYHVPVNEITGSDIDVTFIIDVLAI